MVEQQAASAVPAKCPVITVETVRRGGWINTFSGRAIYPLSMSGGDVDIRDIAHALSLQCRYGGMCGRFYSVAEHSYIVSRIVDPQYTLWALLHDASEAYLVDIPRPVKTAIVGYKESEAAVTACVVEHFDLRPAVEPAAVKLADERILHTERDTLFAAVPQDWCLVAPPVLGLRLYCWSPDVAERMFLQRFDALMTLRTRNEGYSYA